MPAFREPIIRVDHSTRKRFRPAVGRDRQAVREGGQRLQRGRPQRKIVDRARGFGHDRRIGIGEESRTRGIELAAQHEHGSAADRRFRVVRAPRGG